MRTTTRLRNPKNMRTIQNRTNMVRCMFSLPTRSISSISMQTHDKPRYMHTTRKRYGCIRILFWFYVLGSKRCTLFELANCLNVCLCLCVCARVCVKSHKNSWPTATSAQSARSNHSASNTYKLNGTVSHFRSSVYNLDCKCCFTHFLNVIYCLNMVPN